MSIQILEQIFLGSLFLIASFVCFVPLVFFLLNRFNDDLDYMEKIVISSVTGFVLFTLFSYVLAILNLRILLWALPILNLWTVIKYRKIFLEGRFYIQNKLFFWTVFIIGVIGQVAVNAPSGMMYKDGLHFWSSHGHDGIWHISLMDQLSKNIFPFLNPEYAGHALQNYHFFVDLLMSEMATLFRFSSLDIYFRFMPIVFSLLLGLSAFIFVKEWTKKETAGIWSMAFVYFAGSFGYILTLIRDQRIGGEAMFWVSQTQSVLGNPPHAAAFIISTIFLTCLLKYMQSKNKVYFLLCCLLGGAVIEFKVYAGVLLLGGLLFISIYEILIKRVFNLFYLFLSTLVLSLIIYLPNSSNSQEFLIWQPWWFIRTMVVATDRLDWIDMELRRQTYIAESNYKRVIQLESQAFLIFLLGNLGMRFVGFITIFKQLRQNIFKNSFNLFFLVITITSFFIPVFFLQKGVAWNAIQFNQYFLLYFGFLAAIATDGLLSKIKNRKIMIFSGILFIILMVPTQIGLLWQFYSNLPLSKITNKELSALEFIKNNSSLDDIVLTAPFNRYESAKYKLPPIPIYSWYDTGYVSAFSSRNTLIADEEQVTIMGYKAEKLLQQRQEIFITENPDIVNKFLAENNIYYVYLVWGQKFMAPMDKLKLSLVFENDDAKVYKVNK